MMEKYRPHFESLTSEEAALVVMHAARREKLDVAQDQEFDGKKAFEFCEELGLDQADVVIAMSRDSSALGVSVLEKLVGKPIQRTVAASPGGRPRAQRGPRPVLRDDRVIRVLVDSNPKKKGSKTYERFELYRDGMTVQEFRQAGGTADDVKWDAERGFIRVEDPEPKTEESQ